MFVGGVDDYDVEGWGNQQLTIWRPALDSKVKYNWKPTKQEHIESEEEQKHIEEAMEDYYRVRQELRNRRHGY